MASGITAGSFARAAGGANELATAAQRGLLTGVFVGPSSTRRLRPPEP